MKWGGDEEGRRSLSELLQVLGKVGTQTGLCRQDSYQISDPAFGVCGKKEMEESELGKAAIWVPGGCPLNNYPDESSAYPKMNV